VANGLRFYKSYNKLGFGDSEATANVCDTFNNLFDALNRKFPLEGLRLDNKDFKVN